MKKTFLLAPSLDQPAKINDPVPRSLQVMRLRREIKKITVHIQKSTSLDELDKAWGVLCRLQEALALVMEWAEAHQNAAQRTRNHAGQPVLGSTEASS